MKAIQLLEMLENEKYNQMTCSEFAAIVRKHWVIEEDEKEDDLDFLKPDWMPKSVIHHTNKDRS